MPQAQQGMNITDEAQVQADVIGASEIAADAVGASELADNSVASANVIDGTIVNNDINASAAIVDTKLAQIATASKVSGAALTSLASIPAGAGLIPSANLPPAATNLVFLPAASGFFITGGSFADSDVPGVARFADAATTEFVISGAVPSGFTSISSIKVYYRRNAATGNINAQLAIRRGKLSDGSIEEDNDAATTYILDGTINKIASITLDAARYSSITALDGGDPVGVRVSRYGADGSDTYAANFDVVGILFTFA